ncbi:hydantoinase [Alsobacter metallidurans]|uniref:Hydantoinase n=1 Tax=Alsobacter metallidurans TaxID=340221 RepID=A0A917MI47_9HYPH|nr:hydantoinase/oxoprolinase family protein [Alsobacter metallidurans]GGH24390.1 hydantoinase [Alsobacter metallidurans]
MGGIVGIDVGGTFTDLFYSADGLSVDAVLKVPSTPDDPSRGLIDALKAVGAAPASLDVILHGTTIATNAVIERRGARCALITTQGFRDILELGRRDRQRMYGLTGVQQPLIPREMRWEVEERLDHRGEVLTPLDEAGLERLAGALAREPVDAVVISFLHAYANPAHERRAREIVQAANPGWEVVISSDVVREYYEFERTSTATVQAYLQPLVSRYARNLTEKLGELGFERQTLVMQSNGGLIPLSQLSQRAANIVRSGPAAGVMAAARLAAEAGFTHVITGDMGGTSYDVAVVVNGAPRIAETTELDFRVPLRLPMIDVHTIGAGGGSIAFLDRGGTLQVGPRSAGAVPGPVCFGRGGVEPTVTDANAVLGRINAEHPIGMKHLTHLDVEGARAAMAKLGEPLGLGVEQTAEAILTIVDHVMARRTRLLSVEQGHDPRDFALVAFGGAGPLHGAAIMREVGIRTMLLPPHPGVLCALGCAVADLRYDLSQTVETPLAEVAPTFVSEVLTRQRREGEERLAASGTPLDTVAVSHAAEMSYLGQIHTLRAAVEPSWDHARMVQAFEEVYRLEYGNVLGDIPVVLVGLKTAVQGVRAKPASAPGRLEHRPAPVRDHRDVYFGGWKPTPIYDRTALSPGMVFDGPAIIEQADTTSVVEPGMHARVDAFGNILIEVA